jgi:hypothetical protein
MPDSNSHKAQIMKMTADKDRATKMNARKADDFEKVYMRKLMQLQN